MSTLTIRIDSKLERDLARLAKAQKRLKARSRGRCCANTCWCAI